MKTHVREGSGKALLPHLTYFENQSLPKSEAAWQHLTTTQLQVEQSMLCGYMCTFSHLFLWRGCNLISLYFNSNGEEVLHVHLTGQVGLFHPLEQKCEHYEYRSSAHGLQLRDKLKDNPSWGLRERAFVQFLLIRLEPRHSFKCFPELLLLPLHIHTLDHWHKRHWKKNHLNKSQIFAKSERNLSKL